MQGEAAGRAGEPSGDREEPPPQGLGGYHLLAQTRSFDIRADLSALMEEHGPGIYTIWLWGRPSHMDQPAVLSEQSVFWMTQPPERNPYEAHRER